MRCLRFTLRDTGSRVGEGIYIPGLFSENVFPFILFIDKDQDGSRRTVKIQSGVTGGFS